MDLVDISPCVESSTGFLMATIILILKILQFLKLILVNTREREILAWHSAPLSFSGKDRARLEFTFPRGFGHAEEPTFFYVR